MDSPPPSDSPQISLDGKPGVQVFQTGTNPLCKLIVDDGPAAVNRFRLLFQGRDDPHQADELLQLASAFKDRLGNITSPAPKLAAITWESWVSLSGLYHEIVMTDSCVHEFPDLFDYSIAGIDRLFILASIGSLALIYDSVSSAHMIPTELIEMNFKSHLLPVLEKSVIDRLIAPSPPMFRKLWSHRHIFLANDEASRRRFRSMAKLMHNYFDLCYIRKTTPPLEETRIMEFLFLSWFHASEEDGEVLGSVNLEAIGLLGRQASVSYRNSLINNLLLVEFGAEAYVDRFLRDIDQDSRIDTPLEATVSTFHFFFDNKAIVKVLCARNGYARLARALVRQKEQGRKSQNWTTQSECRLSAYASKIIGRALVHLNHPVPLSSDSSQDYAQLIEVVAQAVILCPRAQYDQSHVMIEFIDPMIRILKSLLADGTRCAAVLALARESAKEHWYPAMQSLRAMDPSQKSIQKQFKAIIFLWRRLGETMGLRERKERERIARELAESRKNAQTFCAWSECAHHTQKPEHPLRTCAGCDEVRYCDRNCQTRDWKAGHKKKCRRVKV